MRKRNWNVISFYSVAILFLLLGSYMIFQVYQMLKEYAGLIEWNEMVQYYLSNCSSYFAYAILFYGMALLLKRLNFQKEEQNEDTISS